MKFKVPAVDAPNVNGARLFGLVNGAVADEVGEADLTGAEGSRRPGRVSALYVFDPGPGRLDRRLVLDCRGSSPRHACRC